MQSLSMSLRRPRRLAGAGLLVPRSHPAAAICRTARSRAITPSRYPGALSDSTAVADGDPRSRHHGAGRSLAGAAARAAADASSPRAIPAAPTPASPTISRRQHAAARLDRADAEHLGPSRRPTLSAPVIRRLRCVCSGVHDLIARRQRSGSTSPCCSRRPTDAFLDAMRAGAAGRWRERAGRSTVRFIIGQYPPDNVDVPAFFKALTDGTRPPAGSRSAWRRSAPASRSRIATATRGTTPRSSPSTAPRRWSAAIICGRRTI